MVEQKNPSNYSLEIYKVEYDKLKAEQTQRIQFRDNLLMAHLTVVGAVIGFIVSNAANPLIAYAYLIIPWTSSILGWTYLNNDILISNIRDYLRGELTTSLTDNLGVKNPFGWEHQIGSKKLRVLRKRVQMVMDIATFSIPSFGALARLLYITKPVGHKFFPLLFCIDFFITALLCIGLLYWNFTESRLKNKNDNSSQRQKQDSRFKMGLLAVCRSARLLFHPRVDAQSKSSDKAKADDQQITGAGAKPILEAVPVAPPEIHQLVKGGSKHGDQH